MNIRSILWNLKKYRGVWVIPWVEDELGFELWAWLMACVDQFIFRELWIDQSLANLFLKNYGLVNHWPIIDQSIIL